MATLHEIHINIGLLKDFLLKTYHVCHAAYIALLIDYNMNMNYIKVNVKQTYTALWIVSMAKRATTTLL